MRALLLINARLDEQVKREIAADHEPRKDYLELQRALHADVIDLGVLERSLLTRLLRRCAGASLAQAMLALACSGRYDSIFVDRESAGFALAALLRLRRRRPRLTMIGHMLSPNKKRFVFRALRLQERVDQLIVHSSVQQQIAEQDLGISGRRIALLPYQTDERFWKPRPASQRFQICSAGLEYRDYQTLIDAVTDLDVAVAIAAASHWSTHKGLTARRSLPPTVSVAAYDYGALRRLYAESLFVVVPLHDVENQAGITTILEAMAMGKAVVVSHTRGQIDVVRDRRRVDRTNPRRPTQPEWARSLGAAEETARGHTGIYVRPGDVAEMRRAIAFLLTHPEQARAMGANGRRLVEETMGLDHFVSRISALMRAESVEPASNLTRIAPAI